MTWWFVRIRRWHKPLNRSISASPNPPQVHSSQQRAATASEATNVDVSRQAPTPTRAYRCLRDEVQYRLRLTTRDFLMKTKSQNRWTPRRSRFLARSCTSLCLLLATAWPARSSSQGTSEQRQACTPDVFRLCSSFIPNADDITTCLRERRSELSDACRQVIQVDITQMPSARDGNSIRKRTTR